MGIHARIRIAKEDYLSVTPTKRKLKKAARNKRSYRVRDRREVDTA